MSRDLGRDVLDLEKLYARKLWADFSYPIVRVIPRNCLCLPSLSDRKALASRKGVFPSKSYIFLMH